MRTVSWQCHFPAKRETSRFPCKERTGMPGSQTTQGPCRPRANGLQGVAFRYANSVGTLTNL